MKIQMVKIKRIIWTVALSIVSFSILHGQKEAKFNIGLEYGSNTFYEKAYEKLRYEDFINGVEDYEIQTFSNGAFSGHLTYALSPKWQLGLDFAYQRINFEKYEASSFFVKGDDKLQAKWHTDAFTLGTKLQYTFIDYPMFKAYSAASIAYTNLSIFQNNISGHLTACGIRIGKRLAIFGEVGVGYRGKFSTGLNFQF